MLALVGMAFFAVIREGFETSVFLLAAFDASTRPLAAGGGALLGIVVAVALGWGIYRGGVKINLARFFRFTSVVLVLVAAGLLASALHTAHEADWLNSFQRQALDLEWLVEPGSVRSALLTGMLGLQPRPVVAEVAGYVFYAIPMLLVVLWPRGLRLRVRRAGRRAAGVEATGDDEACASAPRGGARAAAAPRRLRRLRIGLELGHRRRRPPRR